MIKTKMLAVLMVSLMTVVAFAPMVGGGSVDATQLGDDTYIYGTGSNSASQITNNQTSIYEFTQVMENLGTITKVEINSSTAMATAFFLTSDGKLYGLGDNSNGQLGTGNTNNSSTPIQIGAGLGTIDDFKSNNYTLYFLTTDGKLYGCGYNGSGQIGNGTKTNVTTPYQIGAGLGTITEVNTSLNTTFFATSDGKLYGMGAEFYSMFGGSGTTSPMQIGNFGIVDKILMFEHNAFFITSDGKLYGVGTNAKGELGTGSTTPSSISTPTQIGANLGTITDVQNVWYQGNNQGSTYIMTSDGKLYGTGGNYVGQLGVGDRSNKSTPTQIGADLGTITDILVKSGRFYFIADGKLYGAGYNNYNNDLGPGDRNIVQTPIQIGADLGTITKVQVTPTYSTTFFLTSDGKIYGLGSNYGGILGDESPITTPVQVASTIGTIVDYNEYNGRMVIKTSDGKIYGLGTQSYGQMGLGNGLFVDTPTQIGADLGTITDVQNIANNIFIWTSDGKLYASGSNESSHIGVNTVTECLTPTLSNSQSNVIDVSINSKYAQGYTTLFLTSDGKLYGMGNNRYGQLGTGSTTDVNIPTQIGADLGTIVDVSFEITNYQGIGDTYFVTDDGKLYGSGYNAYGQLGIGNTTTQYRFIQIGADLGTIVDVETSGETTFFITDDGKLYGMGRNNYNQQGVADTTSIKTPTQIGAGLGTITKVFCTIDDTFFLTSDGKLYGMGRNISGELGTGDATGVTTPTQINIDFGSIVDISMAPSTTTLFLTSDGKLYGVGDNSNGQLGTGNTTVQLTPVQIGADLGTIMEATVVKGYQSSTYVTIFLTSDGKLYGIGSNYYGQLGTSSPTQITTPVQIGADLGKITTYGSSPFNTYLVANGKLYGMGSNINGQMGNGLKESQVYYKTPTRVGTSNNVMDITCSENNMLYIAGPQRAEITIASNDDNYGMISSSELMVDPGDTITILGNTISYGSDTVTATPTEQTTTNVYVFNGWYNGATLIPDGTITITEDMSITANFSENVRLYDVTIASSNADYGTVSSALVQVPYNTTIASATNTITLGTTPDATVVTATPTTSDAQYTYAFSDWTGVPVGGYITEATSITANFTQTLNSYTITWVIGETSTTETYDYGEMPTHENPTPPEGYYFAGWNPEIATVTGDQTYTAVFSNMTVTFDAGKGTLDGGASKVVVIGQPIGELPTCTAPTNYTFDGWYTAASGGTKVTEDTIVTQEASFTLYAHYELVPALQPVKAILDILPILMAVGLILGAVYVFITRPELATGNNLLYAIVGISVTILVLATFVIPIIGGAL